MEHLRLEVAMLSCSTFLRTPGLRLGPRRCRVMNSSRWRLRDVSRASRPWPQHLCKVLGLLRPLKSFQEPAVFSMLSMCLDTHIPLIDTSAIHATCGAMHLGVQKPRAEHIADLSQIPQAHLKGERK